jgi:Na+/melibiose symporter-like transporter
VHRVGGVILDLIEFPANAVPGTVPEETLVKLALAAGPLLAIGGLASLVLLRSYQISKARHEHTQAHLIDRAPATGAAWDVAQPGAPQTGWQVHTRTKLDRSNDLRGRTALG